MARRVFGITGKDRQTGSERAFFVRAESDDEARDFATRRGIEVGKVAEVGEDVVPAGVPILTAQRRRGDRAEWVPWLDFSFAPPSGYLGAGLLGVLLGLAIYGWTALRTTRRIQDVAMGLQGPDVAGLLRGHTLASIVAVALGVVGLALIALGCIRFAAYQRGPCE